MKYFMRAALAAQVIVVMLWATSKIGEKTTGMQLEWGGAWLFILLCVVFAGHGFAAGVEWANNRGNK